MTDLLITDVGDAWVNSVARRTGQNYGSTNRVNVKSAERWGYLLPTLPNLAGRTVLDAYLVGRAATALDAQTLTVAPVTERWSPGRVTYTNRPAINSAAAVSAPIAATPVGGLVTIPGLAPIIQAVADGTDWHGLRMATNATTSQGFRATNSGNPAWELHVVLSDAPEVPTDLRPNGGKVSTDARTMAWDFLDLGGDNEQAESWLQLVTPAAGVDPDDVAPEYDSAWQLNVDPQWTVPAGPVFSTSEAAPTFWRVNVRDGDGNESGWSDWAEFYTGTRPTLVIDSPTGPFGDVTPQFLAHLDGGTVKSWKIRVTGPDRSDIRYETGLRTGAVDAVIPHRNDDGKRIFREDEQGWAQLSATPEGDWVDAVGSPSAISAWIPADWDDSAAVSPVSNLSVSLLGDGPRRVWSWTRTEAADAFLPMVDGVTIARLGELTPTVGGYEWVDSGEVPPLRPHVLGVSAVEGDARSVPTVVSDPGADIRGFCIIPDADIEPIVLRGSTIGGFSRTDYRATYINSLGEEIDVFYGTPGRTIPFEGSVDKRDDVWATLDRIEALRKSRNRNARVVWGSQSVYARIRDIDATSADEIRANNLIHSVRLNAVQLDD